LLVFFAVFLTATELSELSEAFQP